MSDAPKLADRDASAGGKAGSAGTGGRQDFDARPDASECSSGQMACDGGAPLACIEGTWQAATACTGAAPYCNGGVCGACVNDARRCDAAGRPQLCANGAWQEQPACALNQVCRSGSCTTPPSCDSLAVNCGANRNESCCTSLRVAGGAFNRDNSASYPATVSDFVLDKYEITVGRVRRFVAGYPGNKPAAGAGAHPKISGSGWNAAWNAALPADRVALAQQFGCLASYSTWTDAAGGQEGKPLNCMSWYVAFAFCAWDGGRLPTELEWNYAAAGGAEQRLYPWGPAAPALDNTDLTVWNCRFNVSTTTCPATAYCCTGSSNIAAVGSALSGHGKYGHADLSGNLSEWVLDWSAPYPSTCADCANITPADQRVDRGGAFVSNEASFIRTSSRSSSLPAERRYTTGARCARTP